MKAKPKQILLRNVPEQIRDWIIVEMDRRRMTQNELLLSTLQSAALGGSEPTLFDGLRPDAVVVPESSFFSFVDLFAGIGGFRLGLERAGGYCRMSCEWDKYSQKTYSRSASQAMLPSADCDARRSKLKYDMGTYCANLSNVEGQ